MNVVEPVWERGRQAAIAVALEKDACAAAQHAFVSGHPLDAKAVRYRQRLIGDAAFRWPHALRPHSKDLLVKVEGAHQLFARVFGMAKTILRQGQARRRRRSGIGVTDQGKNRMIKRRGRDFDRSFLRGLGIGGEDLGPEDALSGAYRTPVVAGGASLLA